MLKVEPLWFSEEDKRPYGYQISDESGRECRIAVNYELWLAIECLTPETREKLFLRVLDDPSSIPIGSPATYQPEEKQDTH